MWCDDGGDCVRERLDGVAQCSSGSCGQEGYKRAICSIALLDVADLVGRGLWPPM